MTQMDFSPAMRGRGERKQVTAVFIDVVGFSNIASTADAEDLEQWLEEFYAQSKQIVEAHDGEVTEYLGDGVVALFGLNRADELSASKAVNAALAAVGDINAGYQNSLDVRLRAGVATGEVAVRAAGNDNLPRATGMVTTLAQRIQECAEPGTVLIARSTKDLLRGAVTLHQRPPQQLKGFSDPQDLYQPEPTRRNQREAAQTFFVGREPEVERIKQSNDPCLVIGPAGIGKTALCRHIAMGAQHITQFNADGVHTRASYQPFKDWIAATTQNPLPEFADLQRCFDTLGLPAEAQRALALVLGLPEGQRLLTEKSGVALKTLIEDSLCQAIGLAQPDGLLIFEDLHWLDNASFGVLVHLLQSPDRADYQILMTSREDTKIGKYLDGLAVTMIPLDALSNDDATRMLDAMTDGKAPSKNRDALIEKAAGIPLFLEHLFQRASETDEEQGVPGTLMDLLADQIDATGLSKHVLQHASIIGRNFDIDMLRAVASEFEPLEPHLAKACDRGVLKQQTTDHWTFSHALLHQAAYHGMLRRTRVELHSQIAAHLQAEHPDTVRRNPAILADHLRLSQQYVPAIQSYLAVSQWALFQGAFEDAEAHVLAAISLCDTAPAKVDVSELRIACYNALGSIRIQMYGFMAPNVKEPYDTVLRLTSENNLRTAAIGPALVGGFSHAVISGDRATAKNYCDVLAETATQIPVAETNGELQLASFNIDASLYLYSGQFEQLFTAFDGMKKVYDIAKHGGMITTYGVDTYAAAQMFDSVGRVIHGDTHLAPQLVAETDAHQDLLNIPLMRPYSLIWGSVPLFYAGDVKTALDRVKLGITTAHEQDAAFWQVTGAAWLNVMDPTAGDTIEGRDAFAQVIQTHEAIGARVGIPYFKSIQAVNLARHGHAEEAMQVSLSAIAENEATGLQCWYAEILRLHAKICTLMGETKQALAALEKSVSIATAQQAKLWLIRSRLDQLKAGAIQQSELAEAVALFHPDARPPELITAQQVLIDA
ncbi:ATP-binding protein [Loktanella sp. S4079]|uniref:ATP-binding protein n=1 Tax=Loktanella sp. S4079 TaxID=579483 RepID=UPI000B0D70A4|nr:adenylate/guanylate cyclase domain-containing protein [Loktanella sp. S4079]